MLDTGLAKVSFGICAQEQGENNDGEIACCWLWKTASTRIFSCCAWTAVWKFFCQQNNEQHWRFSAGHNVGARRVDISFCATRRLEMLRRESLPFCGCQFEISTTCQMHERSSSQDLKCNWMSGLKQHWLMKEDLSLVIKFNILCTNQNSEMQFNNHQFTEQTTQCKILLIKRASSWQSLVDQNYIWTASRVTVIEE